MRTPLHHRTRAAVIRRDDLVCGICKGAIDEMEAIHIDHIVPVAKGGSDDLSNLQSAHALCNLKKGARTT